MTTKKLLLLQNLMSRNKRYRKMWVRKVYQERKWKGEFHCSIKEMKLHDHALFFAHFSMSPAKYEHRLAKVAPRLQKCSEKRDPFHPSERLSVTFRYLLVVLYAMVCCQCLVVGCMPLLFTCTHPATKL